MIKTEEVVSIETTSDEKRTFPKASATERNKFVTPDGYTRDEIRTHLELKAPSICPIPTLLSVIWHHVTGF